MTSRRGVEAGREPPRRLPQRDPHRLGVDVRVGGLERDALERRQRPPELLALRRVVGGHPQRALRHADLRRAQPDERAIQHPRRRAAPVGAELLARRAREGAGARPSTGRSWRRPCAPRRVRRDRRGTRRARRRRSTRARARGRRRGAAGTLGFVAVEPPGVAVTGRGDLGMQRVVGAATRRGRRSSTTSPLATPGSHDRCCSGEPNSAIGERAEDEGGPQRHGRDAPPLLLEEQAHLDEAEPAAPVLLGHGDGQQVRRRRARCHSSRSTRSSLRSTSFTRSAVAWPSKICAARSRTASCSSENVKSIAISLPALRVGSAGRPGGSGPGRGRPTRPRPACRR